jgi:hypothetical protein
MVPYVQEIARLHTAQAQLAVLHSFDVVKVYNLAGRFDPMGESKPPPIPYVPSVARLREQAATSNTGAAMQEARFVIEDIAPNWKEYHHRLMDYNNDPRTTFADIQKVLRLLEKRITKRLREESGSDKK